ncbi:MAG: hypothetical protein IT210_25580 [Armatimonadetes bacterium]|nr:hypothetical protein [Armatimonadota bacterium]
MSLPKTHPRRIAEAGKEAQALNLRKQGHTFEQIAEQVGYADRSGAHKAVMRALQRLTNEPAAEARALELLRLDALLLALWPQAEKGDLKAIQSVLNLMARRARYLGLDAPPKAAAPEGGSLTIHERLVDATPAPAED